MYGMGELVVFVTQQEVRKEAQALHVDHELACVHNAALLARREHATHGAEIALHDGFEVVQADADTRQVRGFLVQCAQTAAEQVSCPR